MIARSAFAILLLLGVAGSASARPLLDESSPPAGSTLRRPPAQVSLSFNQALLPSGSDAVVRNASGAVVSSGKSRVSGNKAQVQVPLSSLPSGKYRVEWFATSLDKSHSQGSFSFIVGHDDSAAKPRAQSRRPRAR
jgi:methionine-rich copper-binding protein CopC